MKDLLEDIEGFTGRILILTHINADLDALGSAVALKRYLAGIAPEAGTSIVVPGGPSAYGRLLLDALCEETLPRAGERAGYLFLLDTPTLDQIGPLDPTKLGDFIAVIDHHAPHPDTREVADLYLVREAASSTCEILYPYLRDHIRDDRDAALALLCGIMADSARLRYATGGTIHVLSDLLETSGLELEDANGFLQVPEDISRRTAHLKAAQRAELHRFGDWLVVTSRVNAFASSAAMHLLHLGADCALVASRDGGEVRIHGRARGRFVRETGISLGSDIMPELGRLLGGSGGGHAGAAGARGRDDRLEDAVKLALEMMEKRLAP
ncbi:MAG: hypothetical protein GXO65_06425 [Euryarchaeota archaeon]|nr:hypothetical protein [Euryarchaeota archaeon]